MISSSQVNGYRPVSPEARNLLRNLARDYDFPAENAVILAQVCRTLDEIAAMADAVDRHGVMIESSQGLRLNPALQEITAKRKLITPLIAALELTEECEEVAPAAGFKMTRSESGKKAARARWDERMKRGE